MKLSKLSTIIKEKTIQEVKVFLLRNRIQLYFPNLKTVKNRVNLNYFHAEFSKGKVKAKDSGLRNLGDTLSAPVVEYALRQKGLRMNQPTEKTHHLYAIGSILLMGYQDATVWGSGMFVAPSFIRTLFHRAPFRKLDIRCVRGPLTRKELLRIGHKCPEIYGDPGCLMPLIYKPQVEKTLDYLVIPHYSMEKQIAGLVPAENIASMATDDYKTVIDKICSAKKVISGSLHGIILSESYGVPTIFYQDRSAHFNFKYADWYQSTGRTFGVTTTDLMEAIAMDAGAVPDLTDMQRQLLEVFPYDLWTAKAAE